MKRTYCSNLTKTDSGKKVLLKGWVERTKDMNKIKFLLLRDASGNVQCIGDPNKTEKKTFDIISNITPESVVEIEGEVKESKQAKAGYEVVILNMNVLSESETPLPVDTSSKSNTHIDKRLDNRFLDLRRLEIGNIFKVRSKIFAAVVEFFEKNKFVNINTPKLTAAGVESGATMFEVDYFGRKAFLAQSPQIYKQMGVVSGLERVYEIGAVYRAEKSHTNRHVTEFTGIDFEMGFIKDFNDVMDVIENMFKSVLKNVQGEAKKELELLNVKIKVPNKIPRITMKEAKVLLAQKGKKLNEDDDLDAESEEMLVKIVNEKYGEEFVFVTHYPWSVRPFYHMKPKDKTNETYSFDLLWKAGEIATGAQREHRYKILKAQATEKGVDLDAMKEYADVFRYGCPPHGGVGFGLDRITQRLLGLDNVREVIFLPRDVERLRP